MAGAPRLALALLLLAAAAGPCRAVEMGTSSNIEDLDASCISQLNSLWLKYTNSSGVPGCDAACLSACYTTLNDALYAEKNKNCPLQTDIQRCFRVYSDDWEAYVKDCALFTFSNAESDGEGGTSESGRRRLLAESEAEGEGVAGGGCFPDFEDAESFETYIDGQWQYSEPSNAAGIALSVSFFVGLVVLALFMRS